MDLTALPSRPVDVARFARDAAAGDATRFARRPAPEPLSPLIGEARPGDVIALPGGHVMDDVNENGRVDGYDAVARPRMFPLPAQRVDLLVV
jgi:hypothetical protein